MKLWQKDKDALSEVTRFTVGSDREMDSHLASFDVLGSLAHIQMLETIQLLTKEELKLLTQELKNIYHQISKGDFKIEEGVEDIHSQVELLLTKKLGDVGKKIHSGRSRNDQVLLDVKLFIRSEIQNLTEEIQKLFDLLITKSEEHKDSSFPVTHISNSPCPPLLVCGLVLMQKA
jgi:argininosuccinate lyase